MADVDLPEITTEVKRLTLRRGDVVVVRTDAALDDDGRKKLTASAHRAFAGLPYVPPVIVLTRGMDIEVAGPAEALEPLVRTLRDYIRTHGGSVQDVLGDGP